MMVYDMWDLHGKTIRNILFAAAGLVLVIAFWRQVAYALTLIIGGFVIAFLFEPLCLRFSKRMKRVFAVTASYAVVFAVLIGVLLLLMPALIGQIRDFVASIPAMAGYVEGLVNFFNDWFSENLFFEFKWPEFDLAAMTGGIERVMNGTVQFAGSMVDGFTWFGLMLMLSFYFLLDRERLLLKLELCIPSAWRRMVLRMANGVRRELNIYLRGQFTIALLVGALAALGLAIAGVPSYLVLGFIVGLFNMIPYFGPLLGGIPAFLLAISRGMQTAAWTLLVLFIVQQIDGFIISPRVMSGVTGLSPAFVMIAIAVGGSMAGILGMLFALPLLLIVKICLREWIGRNEMIEIFEEV